MLDINPHIHARIAPQNKITRDKNTHIDADRHDQRRVHMNDETSGQHDDQNI